MNPAATDSRSRGEKPQLTRASDSLPREEVTREEALSELAEWWSKHGTSPFCACGHVVSQCDGSRSGCRKPSGFRLRSEARR